MLPLPSLKKRVLGASEFVNFPVPYQELLRSGGAVPVNDVLLPIWEKELADLYLTYGGRGGGKSEAWADRLLDWCLTDKYFKCYYGRKVFDNVRDSCFATLVACIKKNKLEAYFKFSEADNSSMIITCVNGNKFLPFGSDKAEKLKSIKDPTHIWCEEFDQFTQNDFKDLYPTLRTIRGSNIFVATFNTHSVLPTHWIFKVFFPKLYEGTDKEKDDTKIKDILANKKVSKIFINFTDNYFIDQDAYRELLWIAAAGNYAIFEGIAEGAWGIETNEDPWLFAFNRPKHVAPHELFATPRQILYLAWDFNRNPAACVVLQWPDQQKIQIIDVIKEKNIGTEGICDIILDKYPANEYVYMVTGDYSGDTASSIFKEQVTNYSMIKQKLGISENQIRIQPNPPLAKNQTLVNAVFHRYPVEVCPVKGRPFTYDAERVKKRADGTIVKENRDDPTQQADVLDCVRYWINVFMGWFLVIKDK